jgi:hypothetical protein
MADGAKGSVSAAHQDFAPFTKTERLLALEARPRRFGFVIFEGPTRLLDWGVRSCVDGGKRVEAAVVKGIDPLLKLYAPSAIVMRNRRNLTQNTKVTLRKIVKVVRGEARIRSVDLYLLTDVEVQRFFAEQHSKTKHQIASTLAGWFEELAWKLPKNRRPWQSEDHNMVIFDAAASGVVFLAKERSATQTS